APVRMGAAASDAAAIDAALEARAAIGRGEHRQAVRWAYLAALQSLGRSDRLRPDPSTTHREILRRVPDADACRPPLVALTDRSERTWHGSLTAGPDASRLAVDEMDRIGCALFPPSATARS